MTQSYRLAVTADKGRPAVLVEQSGRLVPLARFLQDDDLQRLGGSAPEDLMPLLADWDYWRKALPKRFSEAASIFATDGLAAEKLHFAPPIALPNKLICIGSNYHDHVKEMGIPMLPSYPYSFLKMPSTTLRGSGATVTIPKIAKMVDWEAELAVIIGARSNGESAKQALGIVAGYANLNDLSARDWLANRPNIGVDWVRHKCFDGFAPCGPYFVPKEFVPDPQDLAIELKVNGAVRQKSTTGQMIFGVAEIIEHLASIMTLEPGDIIATGTPAGTGYGLKPQIFLKAGDVVEIEIGPLGRLETRMA